MSQSFSQSRREFIKKSAWAIAAGAYGQSMLPMALGQTLSQSKSDDPSVNDHFFLQVMVPQGMDWSYLFDARPLAMTQANLIQNYTGAEPSLWAHPVDNGNSTWASELTRPLIPLAEYFSIVNGILMSPSFDGHDQNLNLYFTGSPFGGESFVPSFTRKVALSEKLEVELDYLQLGRLFYQVNNAGNTLSLARERSREVTRTLAQKMNRPAEDAVYSYLAGRAAQLQKLSSGQLSRSMGALVEVMSSAPRVGRKISQIRLQDPAPSGIRRDLELIREYYRTGLCRSAILSLDHEVDTHASVSARQQPALYAAIVSDLLSVVQGLREIPFDDRRSMMEVTTFVVTTEFGRTLRQENRAIDQTGTDHNQLSNSLMIGGKGIRTGMVIGQSDFRSVNEELSAVHLALDNKRLKTMGQAYDFSRNQIFQDRSPVFKAENYLTVGSVVNSLFRCFSVPAEYYRKLDASEKHCPVLSSLLV